MDTPLESEEYLELQTKLLNEDLTEVSPPQPQLNYKQIAKDYWKTIVPPVVQWIPNYDRKKLQGDCIAGLTVGVILIPQGMAYGLLAGLPPIYGLYAALIAPLLYSVFGSSMQLTVGPVAITALLTASGVRNLNPQTDEEYIHAAIVLGFMSGLILVLMGLLRIGFIVEFLSNTVVSGFISASAAIILISQLKDILGIKSSGDNALEELISVFKNIGSTNGWAVLGSVVCFVVLLGTKQIKKIPKWLPVELILMLLAILLSWAAGLDSKIKTVGPVPSGLPPFTVPQLQEFPFDTVAYQAFIIALLSYIGSIALARAFGNAQNGIEVDANKELIALGMAGMFGAFASGHPVSGSFSRTAINSEMGAKSPFAGIVTAFVVLICLLLLTSIFEYLPKFVLAAIVAVSVRKLFDYKEAMYLWKVDKSEFAVIATTFLCTIFIGIETGIIASIFISLVIVLARTSRPVIIPLGRIPNSIVYRNALRHPQCIKYPGIAIFRIEAELYFANILRFRQYVHNLIKSEEGLQVIIVDASSINSIDPTALRMLETLINDLSKKSISLAFACAHAKMREALLKGGITSKLEISPKLQIHQVVQHFARGRARSRSQPNVANNDQQDVPVVVPLEDIQ